ncbi:ATP-binding cassette domain-containing protein [Shimazuella alba]|uniref:ATP-binding cassette domain-containing protein n=1 Tax=Shimazuella alba TaxID=2690964 RepID=UPI00308467E5
MNAIELTNLTKQYGTSRGIIDVNITIEQSEVFGFIGPNGAGKSTTSARSNRCLGARRSLKKTA